MTETMTSILQSQSAKMIIKWLTPQYGEAYFFLWLIQVVGMQLDKTEEWSEKFYSELSPQSATWSIELWEKQYAIVPENWWTLEQRRQNIQSKMYSFLPMNPKRLADIASNAAGVKVEIIENTDKNSFDVLVRDTGWGVAATRRVLDKCKPAHLIYNIRVAKKMQVPLHTSSAVAVTRHKIYRVEVD